jgi:hypothetical protein
LIAEPVLHTVVPAQDEKLKLSWMGKGTGKESSYRRVHAEDNIASMLAICGRARRKPDFFLLSAVMPVLEISHPLAFAGLDNLAIAPCATPECNHASSIEEAALGCCSRERCE